MDDTEAGINKDLDLGKVIAERDAQIVVLTETLTERDAQIVVLNQTIEERDKALAERDARITGMTDSLDAARAEIEVLRHPVEPAAAPVPNGTPSEIQLTDPHGFIDDNGRHLFWSAGTRISDRHEIAMLIGRGATHTVLREAPPPSEPASQE